MPFDENMSASQRKAIEVLTGIPIPKASINTLGRGSEVYAALEKRVKVLDDLFDLSRVHARRHFNGNTARNYEHSLDQFTTGDNDYVGSARSNAATMSSELFKARANVEYMHMMVIGQFVQLLAEIAWAIATAKFTFGASLKWIPIFKAIRSLAIRRILTWLLITVPGHQIISQIFASMDSIIQRIQIGRGTRHHKDPNLTRSAHIGATIEGALSAVFSAGMDGLFSKQLTDLFNDRVARITDLPDPPPLVRTEPDGGGPPPTGPLNDAPDAPPPGPPSGGGPDGPPTGPVKDTPPPGNPNRDTDTPPPPGGGPDGPPSGPVKDDPPATNPDRGPDSPAPKTTPETTPAPKDGPLPPPSLNKDLAEVFVRHKDEFLVPYNPASPIGAGVFDNAAKAAAARNEFADLFARHFGDHIGDAAARDLGRDYADTLARNWTDPNLAQHLRDTIGDRLPPTTRDHLSDVPVTLQQPLNDYFSKTSTYAQQVGGNIGTGALEGYLGEGLGSMADGRGWEASGYSATAGATQAGIQQGATDGILHGADLFKDKDKPDLNTPPPQTESRGSGNRTDDRTDPGETDPWWRGDDDPGQNGDRTPERNSGNSPAPGDRSQPTDDRDGEPAPPSRDDEQSLYGSDSDSDTSSVFDRDENSSPYDSDDEASLFDTDEATPQQDTTNTKTDKGPGPDAPSVPGPRNEPLGVDSPHPGSGHDPFRTGTDNGPLAADFLNAIVPDNPMAAAPPDTEQTAPNTGNTGDRSAPEQEQQQNTAPVAVAPPVGQAAPPPSPAPQNPAPDTGQRPASSERGGGERSPQRTNDTTGDDLQTPTPDPTPQTQTTGNTTGQDDHGSPTNEQHANPDTVSVSEQRTESEDGPPPSPPAADERADHSDTTVRTESGPPPQTEDNNPLPGTLDDRSPEPAPPTDSRDDRDAPPTDSRDDRDAVPPPRAEEQDGTPPAAPVPPPAMAPPPVQADPSAPAPAAANGQRTPSPQTPPDRITTAIRLGEMASASIKDAISGYQRAQDLVSQTREAESQGRPDAADLRSHAYEAQRQANEAYRTYDFLARMQADLLRTDQPVTVMTVLETPASPSDDAGPVPLGGTDGDIPLGPRDTDSPVHQEETAPEGTPPEGTAPEGTPPQEPQAPTYNGTFTPDRSKPYDLGYLTTSNLLGPNMLFAEHLHGFVDDVLTNTPDMPETARQQILDGVADILTKEGPRPFLREGGRTVSATHDGQTWSADIDLRSLDGDFYHFKTESLSGEDSRHLRLHNAGPGVSSSESGSQNGSGSVGVKFTGSPIYLANVSGSDAGPIFSIGVRGGSQVRSTGGTASVSANSGTGIELLGTPNVYVSDLRMKASVTGPGLTSPRVREGTSYDGLIMNLPGEAVSSDGPRQITPDNGKPDANGHHKPVNRPFIGAGHPLEITRFSPAPPASDGGTGGDTASGDRGDSTDTATAGGGRPGQNSLGTWLADHLLPPPKGKRGGDHTPSGKEKRNDEYRARIEAAFDNDQVQQYLPQMSNGSAHIRIDIPGSPSRYMRMWSVSTQYDRKDFAPGLVDFVHSNTTVKSVSSDVQRSTTVSGSIGTGFGIWLELPDGKSIRLEAPAVEYSATLRKSTGTTLNTSGAISDIVHAPSGHAAYDVKRDFYVHIQGEPRPHRFEGDSVELLSVEDARLLNGELPKPPSSTDGPVAPPRPPFPNLAVDRPTNLSGSTVLGFGHVPPPAPENNSGTTGTTGNANTTSSTTGNTGTNDTGTANTTTDRTGNDGTDGDTKTYNSPESSFYDDLAYEVLKGIAEKHPGMVIPDLARTRKDYAVRPSHMESDAVRSFRERWGLRRNADVARENTQKVREALSESRIKSSKSDLPYDGIPVRLRETAVIDGKTVLPDRGLRPDHVTLRVYGEFGKLEHQFETTASGGGRFTGSSGVTVTKGSNLNHSLSFTVGGSVRDDARGDARGVPGTLGNPMVALFTSLGFGRDSAQSISRSVEETVLFNGDSDVWTSRTRFTARLFENDDLGMTRDGRSQHEHGTPLLKDGGMDTQVVLLTPKTSPTAPDPARTETDTTGTDTTDDWQALPPERVKDMLTLRPTPTGAGRGGLWTAVRDGAVHTWGRLLGGGADTAAPSQNTAAPPAGTTTVTGADGNQTVLPAPPPPPGGTTDTTTGTTPETAPLGGERGGDDSPNDRPPQDPPTLGQRRAQALHRAGAFFEHVRTHFGDRDQTPGLREQVYRALSENGFTRKRVSYLSRSPGNGQRIEQSLSSEVLATDKSTTSRFGSRSRHEMSSRLWSPHKVRVTNVTRSEMGAVTDFRPVDAQMRWGGGSETALSAVSSRSGNLGLRFGGGGARNPNPPGSDDSLPNQAVRPIPVFGTSLSRTFFSRGRSHNQSSTFSSSVLFIPNNTKAYAFRASGRITLLTESLKNWSIGPTLDWKTLFRGWTRPVSDLASGYVHSRDAQEEGMVQDRATRDGDSVDLSPHDNPDKPENARVRPGFENNGRQIQPADPEAAAQALVDSLASNGLELTLGGGREALLKQLTTHLAQNPDPTAPLPLNVRALGPEPTPDSKPRPQRSSFTGKLYVELIRDPKSTKVSHVDQADYYIESHTVKATDAHSRSDETSRTVSSDGALLIPPPYPQDDQGPDGQPGHRALFTTPAGEISGSSNDGRSSGQSQDDARTIELHLKTPYAKVSTDTTLKLKLQFDEPKGGESGRKPKSTYEVTADSGRVDTLYSLAYMTFDPPAADTLEGGTQGTGTDTLSPPPAPAVTTSTDGTGSTGTAPPDRNTAPAPEGGDTTGTAGDRTGSGTTGDDRAPAPAEDGGTTRRSGAPIYASQADALRTWTREAGPRPGTDSALALTTMVQDYGKALREQANIVVARSAGWKPPEGKSTEETANAARAHLADVYGLDPVYNEIDASLSDEAIKAMDPSASLDPEGVSFKDIELPGWIDRVVRSNHTEWGAKALPSTRGAKILDARPDGQLSDSRVRPRTDSSGSSHGGGQGFGGGFRPAGISTESPVYDRHEGIYTGAAAANTGSSHGASSGSNQTVKGYQESDQLRQGPFYLVEHDVTWAFAAGSKLTAPAAFHLNDPSLPQTPLHSRPTRWIVDQTTIRMAKWYSEADAIAMGFLTPDQVKGLGPVKDGIHKAQEEFSKAEAEYADTRAPLEGLAQKYADKPDEQSARKAYEDQEKEYTKALASFNQKIKALVQTLNDTRTALGGVGQGTNGGTVPPGRTSNGDTSGGTTTRTPAPANTTSTTSTTGNTTTGTDGTAVVTGATSGNTTTTGDTDGATTTTSAPQPTITVTPPPDPAPAPTGPSQALADRFRAELNLVAPEPDTPVRDTDTVDARVQRASDAADTADREARAASDAANDLSTALGNGTTELGNGNSILTGSEGGAAAAGADGAPAPGAERRAHDARTAADTAHTDATTTRDALTTTRDDALAKRPEPRGDASPEQAETAATAAGSAAATAQETAEQHRDTVAGLGNDLDGALARHQTLSTAVDGLSGRDRPVGGDPAAQDTRDRAAREAREEADSLVSDLEDIAERADTARDAAETARTDAAKAKSEADAAKANADRTAADAEALRTWAEGLSTSASEHRDSADRAAQDAQRAAEEAQRAADTAEEARAAADRAAEVSTRAEAATDRVKQADDHARAARTAADRAVRAAANAPQPSPGGQTTSDGTDARGTADTRQDAAHRTAEDARERARQARQTTRDAVRTTTRAAEDAKQLTEQAQDLRTRAETTAREAREAAARANEARGIAEETRRAADATVRTADAAAADARRAHESAQQAAQQAEAAAKSAEAAARTAEKARDDAENIATSARERADSVRRLLERIDAAVEPERTSSDDGREKDDDKDGGRDEDGSGDNGNSADGGDRSGQDRDRSDDQHGPGTEGGDRGRGTEPDHGNRSRGGGDQDRSAAANTGGRGRPSPQAVSDGITTAIRLGEMASASIKDALNGYQRAQDLVGQSREAESRGRPDAADLRARAYQTQREANEAYLNYRDFARMQADLLRPGNPITVMTVMTPPAGPSGDTGPVPLGGTSRDIPLGPPDTDPPVRQGDTSPEGAPPEGAPPPPPLPALTYDGGFVPDRSGQSYDLGYLTTSNLLGPHMLFAEHLPGFVDDVLANTPGMPDTARQGIVDGVVDILTREGPRPFLREGGRTVNTTQGGQTWSADIDLRSLGDDFYHVDAKALSGGGDSRFLRLNDAGPGVDSSDGGSRGAGKTVGGKFTMSPFYVTGVDGNDAGPIAAVGGRGGARVRGTSGSASASANAASGIELLGAPNVYVGDLGMRASVTGPGLTAPRVQEGTAYNGLAMNLPGEVVTSDAPRRIVPDNGPKDANGHHEPVNRPFTGTGHPLEITRLSPAPAVSGTGTGVSTASGDGGTGRGGEDGRGGEGDRGDGTDRRGGGDRHGGTATTGGGGRPGGSTLGTWLADHILPPPEGNRGGGRTPSGKEKRNDEYRARIEATFDNDRLQQYLPQMSNSSAHIRIEIPGSHPRIMRMWSVPTQYDRKDFAPGLADFVHSNTAVKSDSSSVKHSSVASGSIGGGFGIWLELPNGKSVRLDLPFVEYSATFEKSTGTALNTSGTSSHVVHAPSGHAAYDVKRDFYVHIQGEPRPHRFEGDSVELLTVEDARQLNGELPKPPSPADGPAAPPRPPFPNLAVDRPTDLSGATVRGFGHLPSPVPADNGGTTEGTGNNGADGDTRTPPSPQRPFYDDLAYRVLSDIAEKRPGMVIPDLARTGKDYAVRPSHMESDAVRSFRERWGLRRNVDVARENTLKVINALSESGLRSGAPDLPGNGVPVRLKESAVIDPKMIRKDRGGRPETVTVRVYGDFDRLEHQFDTTASGGARFAGSAGITTTKGSSVSHSLGVNVGASVRTDAGADARGVPRVMGNPSVALNASLNDGKGSSQGLSHSSEETVLFNGDSDVWTSRTRFTARLFEHDDIGMARDDRPQREHGIPLLGKGMDAQMVLLTPKTPPTASDSAQTVSGPADTTRDGETATSSDGRETRDAPETTAATDATAAREGDSAQTDTTGNTAPATTGVRQPLTPEQARDMIVRSFVPRISADGTAGDDRAGRWTVVRDGVVQTWGRLFGGGTEVVTASQTTTAPPAGTTTVTGTDQPAALTSPPPPGGTANTTGTDRSAALTTPASPGNTTNTSTGTTPEDTRTGGDRDGDDVPSNRPQQGPLTLDQARAQAIRRIGGTFERVNTHFDAGSRGMRGLLEETYRTFSDTRSGLHDGYRRKLESFLSDSSGGGRQFENHLSAEELAASRSVTTPSGSRIRQEMSGGLWSPHDVRATVATRVDIDTVTDFRPVGAQMRWNGGSEVTLSTTSSLTGGLGLRFGGSGTRNPNPHPSDDSLPNEAVRPIPVFGTSLSRTFFSRGTSHTQSTSFTSSVLFIPDNTRVYAFRASGRLTQAIEFTKNWTIGPPLNWKTLFHGWTAPVQNLLAGYVHSRDAQQEGLVLDQATRDGDRVDLSPQPNPKKPENARVRPGFEDNGRQIQPADPEAAIQELVNDLASNGLELTSGGRELLLQKLTTHLGQNPDSTVPVPVKVRALGPEPTSDSRPHAMRSATPAKVYVNLTRDPSRTEVSYVGQSGYYIESHTWKATDADSRSRGTGTTVGADGVLLQPLPYAQDDQGSEGQPEHRPLFGAPAGAVSSSGNDGRSSGQSQDDARTTELHLNTPYAKVGADTRLTLTLELGEPKGGENGNPPRSTYTGTADSGRVETLYPFAYMTFDPPATTTTATTTGDGARSTGADLSAPPPAVTTSTEGTGSTRTAPADRNTAPAPEGEDATGDRTGTDTTGNDRAPATAEDGGTTRRPAAPVHASVSEALRAWTNDAGPRPGNDSAITKPAMVQDGGQALRDKANVVIAQSLGWQPPPGTPEGGQPTRAAADAARAYLADAYGQDPVYNEIDHSLSDKALKAVYPSASRNSEGVQFTDISRTEWGAKVVPSNRGAKILDALPGSQLSDSRVQPRTNSADDSHGGSQGRGGEFRPSGLTTGGVPYDGHEGIHTGSAAVNTSSSHGSERGSNQAVKGYQESDKLRQGPVYLVEYDATWAFAAGSKLKAPAAFHQNDPSLAPTPFYSRPTRWGVDDVTVRMAGWFSEADAIAMGFLTPDQAKGMAPAMDRLNQAREEFGKAEAAYADTRAPLEGLAERFAAEPGDESAESAYKEQEDKYKEALRDFDRQIDALVETVNTTRTTLGEAGQGPDGGTAPPVHAVSGDGTATRTPVTGNTTTGTEGSTGNRTGNTGNTVTTTTGTTGNTTAGQTTTGTTGDRGVTSGTTTTTGNTDGTTTAAREPQPTVTVTPPDPSPAPSGANQTLVDRFMSELNLRAPEPDTPVRDPGGSSGLRDGQEQNTDTVDARVQQASDTADTAIREARDARDAANGLSTSLDHGRADIRQGTRVLTGSEGGAPAAGTEGGAPASGTDGAPSPGAERRARDARTAADTAHTDATTTRDAFTTARDDARARMPEPDRDAFIERVRTTVSEAADADTSATSAREAAGEQEDAVADLVDELDATPERYRALSTAVEGLSGRDRPVGGDPAAQDARDRAAREAREEADSLVSDLEDIAERADTARDAAETARTDAAKAKSEADAAKAKADRTAADAEALRTWAEGLSTSASEHRDSADRAAQDARNAHETARRAAGAAGEARAAANEAAARADEVRANAAEVAGNAAQAEADARTARTTADLAAQAADASRTSSGGRTAPGGTGTRGTTNAPNTAPGDTGSRTAPNTADDRARTTDTRQDDARRAAQDARARAQEARQTARDAAERAARATEDANRLTRQAQDLRTRAETTAREAREAAARANEARGIAEETRRAADSAVRTADAAAADARRAHEYAQQAAQKAETAAERAEEAAETAREARDDAGKIADSARKRADSVRRLLERIDAAVEPGRTSSDDGPPKDGRGDEDGAGGEGSGKDRTGGGGGGRSRGEGDRSGSGDDRSDGGGGSGTGRGSGGGGEGRSSRGNGQDRRSPRGSAPADQSDPFSDSDSDTDSDTDSAPDLDAVPDLVSDDDLSLYDSPDTPVQDRPFRTPFDDDHQFKPLWARDDHAFDSLDPKHSGYGSGPLSFLDPKSLDAPLGLLDSGFGSDRPLPSSLTDIVAYPMTGAPGQRGDTSADGENDQYTTGFHDPSAAAYGEQPAASTEETAQDRDGDQDERIAALMLWNGTFAGVEDLAETTGFDVVSQQTLVEDGSDGSTTLMRFANGAQAVYKDTEGATFARDRADAEQLASLVGRAIGANVPGVLRIGETEVFMHFMNGESGFAHLDNPRSPLLNTRDGHVLGLLDLLIANGDRNPGNWLDQGRGRVAGIDHGKAWFKYEYTPEDPTDLEGLAYTNGMRPFYDFDANAWIANPLTRADIRFLRARLAGLSGEFARLGRSDWFDEMMERFDKLAHNARGTTGLFSGGGR
ncbi:hypothetical protein [Nocardiopsis dassonvillei]|uniref:hypothetical protein n=2 Tax=Nocardiopsis TaxID=2013 RepID=UPI00366E85C3